MILNFVALGTMGIAALAGGFLCRRYFPRGSGASFANVCLNCENPAALLTSFNCAGCGRDVREAGVGTPGRRSPLKAFGAVVLFTMLYVIGAGITVGVLANAAPRTDRVSKHVSIQLSSPEIHGVDLFLETRGRNEREFEGLLSGEMYSTGGVIFLEVDIPAKSWRLRDADDKVLEEGPSLSGEVAYRWMRNAKVPTDGAIAHSDATHIANHLGQLAGAPLDMPPVPETGRALSLSYSSSTGGSSSFEPDPRALPLIVMAAALGWVAGVWLVLAWSARPARQAVVNVPLRAEGTAA